MPTSSAQRTIRDVAADGSEEEMVKLLLSNRSKGKEKDADWLRTLLHIARNHEDMRVAKVQPTLNNTCIQN
jgi:ATP-dependent exoDNAse (exonuclease V) alpha subunit